MSDLSGKNILIVIAPTDFKDEEYYIPKETLENAGAKITTASKSSEATSVMGKTQKVDVLLSEATTDYDAIVFVGGPGAHAYLNDAEVLKLAKDFYNTGKLTTAICIGPAILANAEILKGKKATVFPTSADILKAKGAIYTAEPVTVDGKIITAEDPDAAEEFAEKIAENL